MASDWFKRIDNGNYWELEPTFTDEALLFLDSLIDEATNPAEEVGDDIAFDLGNLITIMRLEAGLTQQELAKRMGTRQPNVARAERGAIEPSMSFLKRAADAAGMKLYMPFLRAAQSSTHPEDTK